MVATVLELDVLVGSYRNSMDFASSMTVPEMLQHVQEEVRRSPPLRRVVLVRLHILDREGRPLRSLPSTRMAADVVAALAATPGSQLAAFTADDEKALVAHISAIASPLSVWGRAGGAQRGARAQFAHPASRAPDFVPQGGRDAPGLLRRSLGYAAGLLFGGDGGEAALAHAPSPLALPAPHHPLMLTNGGAGSAGEGGGSRKRERGAAQQPPQPQAAKQAAGGGGRGGGGSRGGGGGQAGGRGSRGGAPAPEAAAEDEEGEEEEEEGEEEAEKEAADFDRLAPHAPDARMTRAQVAAARKRGTAPPSAPPPPKPKPKEAAPKAKVVKAEPEGGNKAGAGAISGRGGDRAARAASRPQQPKDAATAAAAAAASGLGTANGGGGGVSPAPGSPPPPASSPLPTGGLSLFFGGPSSAPSPAPAQPPSISVGDAAWSRRGDAASLMPLSPGFCAAVTLSAAPRASGDSPLMRVARRIAPFLRDGDIVVDASMTQSREWVDAVASAAAVARLVGRLASKPSDVVGIAPHRLVLGLAPPWGVKGHMCTAWMAQAMALSPRLLVLVAPPAIVLPGGYLLVDRAR